MELLAKQISGKSGHIVMFGKPCGVVKSSFEAESKHKQSPVIDSECFADTLSTVLVAVVPCRLRLRPHNLAEQFVVCGVVEKLDQYIDRSPARSNASGGELVHVFKNTTHMKEAMRCERHAGNRTYHTFCPSRRLRPCCRRLHRQV